MMKILMGAQGFIQKSIKEFPTRAERKELKKLGTVNMRDRDELIKATAALRESKKAPPKELPPTQEELLAEILAELKKQTPISSTEQEPIKEVKAKTKTKKA